MLKTNKYITNVYDSLNNEDNIELLMSEYLKECLKKEFFKQLSFKCKEKNVYNVLDSDYDYIIEDFLLFLRNQIDNEHIYFDIENENFSSINNLVNYCKSVLYNLDFEKHLKEIFLDFELNGNEDIIKTIKKVFQKEDTKNIIENTEKTIEQKIKGSTLEELNTSLKIELEVFDNNDFKIIFNNIPHIINNKITSFGFKNYLKNWQGDINTVTENPNGTYSKEKIFKLNDKYLSDNAFFELFLISNAISINNIENKYDFNTISFFYTIQPLLYNFKNNMNKINKDQLNKIKQLNKTINYFLKTIESGDLEIFDLGYTLMLRDELKIIEENKKEKKKELIKVVKSEKQKTI
jgi:hypothetical protein